MSLAVSEAGTAEQAEGRDYTAEWAEETITVAAGETEASTTLSVDLNDDNLAEGDTPETIILEGASAVTAGATTTPEDLEVTGTELTVTDNDVAPTSIALTVGTSSVDEGAGETAVEVTATLGDGSTALIVDTEVTVSLSGTDETLGPDFDAEELTFTVPAEQTAASASLTLTPNDDNLAGEGDETIEVAGAADGFTVESAAITLTDNDVVPTSITLAVDTASLDEGAGETAINVTATLGDGSTALITETTVALSLSGTDEALGPDYSASDVTITVAPGATGGSGTLTLTPNDDNLAGEGDETIEVAGAADGFTVESATITLTDNDVVPTSITLAVDTESLDEGAGETAIEVTATLGDDSTALITDTQVALSLSGTHVDLGPDYEDVEVTVTVAAGATNGSGTLPLTPIDDILAG